MGVTDSDIDELEQALTNPGRLVLAPTDMSQAFPYGGMEIDVVVDFDIEWKVDYYDDNDPASGVLVGVGRRAPEYPRIVFLLSGPRWNSQVLAATMSKTTTGANTPTEKRLEGTLIPQVVAAWNPILFAPLNEGSGKAVYFRRPVPRLSVRQSVAFQERRKAGLPIVFDPTPDANWATTPYWQIARLENLTL